MQKGREVHLFTDASNSNCTPAYVNICLLVLVMQMLLFHFVTFFSIWVDYIQVCYIQDVIFEV